MIKVILFDFGGVLSKDLWGFANSKGAAKYLGVNAKKFFKIFDEDFTEWDLGRVTEAVFFKTLEVKIKMLNEHLPLDAKEVFKDLIMTSYPLDLQMLHFALSLKKKYKVGVLSNLNVMQSTYFTKMHEFKKKFDYVFWSCEHGVVKPDQKYFKIAIKKVRKKPSEILFIDNKQKHVNAARKAGMKAILFKSKKQLILALKKK